VSEHADYNAVWVANEEAMDAPGLVDRTVDHLVSSLHGFGVRGINGRPRAHVDAHVWQDGLNARGCEDDLRLGRAEADVATAEGALLKLEHARIKRAGGVEVARLVVGDDATDGHGDSLAPEVLASGRLEAKS
jgi:hypothetical protein